MRVYVCWGLSVETIVIEIYHIFHNLSRLVALSLLLRLLIFMIEDLSKSRSDLLISRVLRYVDDDDEEAVFFCLHFLLEEVEFEFEVDVDVVVDELELEVDEDEDEDVPMPDKLARRGTVAFGAGVGIET